MIDMRSCEQAVHDGLLDGTIVPWEPWWTTDNAVMEERTYRDSGMPAGADAGPSDGMIDGEEEEVGGGFGMGSGIPPIPEDVPPLSSLTSKQPSPLLPYTVAAILWCYALCQRRCSFRSSALPHLLSSHLRFPPPHLSRLNVTSWPRAGGMAMLLRTRKHARRLRESCSWLPDPSSLLPNLAKLHACQRRYVLPSWHVSFATCLQLGQLRFWCQCKGLREHCYSLFESIVTCGHLGRELRTQAHLQNAQASHRPECALERADMDASERLRSCCVPGSEQIGEAVQGCVERLVAHGGLGQREQIIDSQMLQARPPSES